MDNKIIVNGQVVAHSSNSYNNLDEVTLPMINSAKLIGNLTSSELNMYTKAEVEKLVASARSVKLVENYPSSPSAGILYYVGTEAPYQVCTYSTDTLARIDLGSTETDLSEYVKLIPSHKDETGKVIYEVGHNEGIDDGRELVAHSVTGIINEIDTALQDRVNVLENDLTTENKKVVEAINELDGEIGDVSTLKTTEKDDVVKAINSLTFSNKYYGAVLSNGMIEDCSSAFICPELKYDGSKSFESFYKYGQRIGRKMEFMVTYTPKGEKSISIPANGYIDLITNNTNSVVIKGGRYSGLDDKSWGGATVVITPQDNTSQTNLANKYTEVVSSWWTYQGQDNYWFRIQGLRIKNKTASAVTLYTVNIKVEYYIPDSVWTLKYNEDGSPKA